MYIKSLTAGKINSPIYIYIYILDAPYHISLKLR